MSECELPEFYQASEQTARKEYRCCECSARVLKGERYLLAVGKWGGVFNKYRQHTLCARACEFIRDSLWNDGECIGFGELFNWINTDAWGMKDWNRKKPDHKEFRAMIARIKWRERTGKISQEAGKVSGETHNLG